MEFLDLRLTIRVENRYNSALVLKFQEELVESYLDIALIITSISLIASIVLQSKGVGLGGLTGGDTGGVFTARRGIEKTLFYVTIGLSALFFILILVIIIVKK
jgi:preprotein translocase subunit SecG